MLRFLAGVVSTLLLVAAGIFIWRSQAEAEQVIPPAPKARTFAGSLLQQHSEAAEPPAASEKTKEQKRFARADKDDDGRITRAELLEPRRKAFAKLDTNGNGSLSFEEWAVKTAEKFSGADADRSGFLTPAEYETTKAKTRPKKKCAC
jgi:Ca2+-binding EF-hand superfamily protein